MNEELKKLREQRERTKDCDTCRGTGKVTVKTWHSLVLPEEDTWGIVNKHLTGIRGVPRNAYVCGSRAGASIHDAIKEAQTIALVVKRPVAFDFNGRACVVHGDSDLDDVYCEWWRSVYGEIPEESLAKR